MIILSSATPTTRARHSARSASQQWRAVRLQFTDEHVYWGADTNHPELKGIYRWSRRTGQVEKLLSVGGPLICGCCLAGGTWVYSADREGMGGLQWVFGEDRSKHYLTEPDEIPSLWISVDHEKWKRLKFTRWLPQARPSFGVVRVAPNDGALSLAVTCINMEKYNNCLMIFSESELRRWWEQP